MIEAQRIQNERALEIMSGTNAQSELEVIREKSASYFLMVQNVLLELSSDPKNEKELEKIIDPLLKKGYELMFYAPPELAAKSVNLNIKMASLVKGVGLEDYDEKKKEVDGALQEWIKSYISEVERYRRHTMPAKFKEDFLNAILKSLSKK